MMSRVWLLILCAYLALWQPLAFAAEVATSIDTLGMRGLAGLLELVAHAIPRRRARVDRRDDRRWIC